MCSRTSQSNYAGNKLGSHAPTSTSIDSAASPISLPTHALELHNCLPALFLPFYVMLLLTPSCRNSTSAFAPSLARFMHLSHDPRRLSCTDKDPVEMHNMRHTPRSQLLLPGSSPISGSSRVSNSLISSPAERVAPHPGVAPDIKHLSGYFSVPYLWNMEALRFDRSVYVRRGPCGCIDR